MFQTAQNRKIANPDQSGLDWITENAAVVQIASRIWLTQRLVPISFLSYQFYLLLFVACFTVILLLTTTFKREILLELTVHNLPRRRMYRNSLSEETLCRCRGICEKLRSETIASAFTWLFLACCCSW
jgi:hypothetical protein